ncbi:MAG: STAS domain-containing protein [Acidobacteriota bacterium]|jgi:anti-anti-sigma factor|nr:STAS domain-containing protein [Acidobacteriota bacterium]
MHMALRESDGIVIISLAGDICRSKTSPTTLHAIIKSQLEQGSRHFLLNLEQVGIVDSFGIGELLAGYVSIRNAGGKMGLIGIPRRLEVVFRIVGLNRVFEVFRTESSALQTFGAR